MTRTLEAAIAKLATLPTEASRDALGKLAAEARADRAAGRTTDLDADKL